MTPTNEQVDGPDPKGAARAVTEAKQETEKTTELVKRANLSFALLKQIHEDNHFVQRLRSTIRPKGAA